MAAKSKTRILGVDPGTRYVGWGVVDASGSTLAYVASGVIDVTREKVYSLRLKAVFDGLTEVIKTYSPSVVSVEDAFFSRNVQSAFRIGEGRAVAILAGAQNGLDVFEYAPTEIKKSVAAGGRAHKSQVKSMVLRLLGLKPEKRRTDETDALAIAICHHHRKRFKMS